MKVQINQRSGFTLLEILITISILAVIASIGFASFSQTQKLGRDAKRKQDLRAISQALTLYFQTNKRYPCTGTTFVSKVYSTSSNPTWITDSESGCAASAIPLDAKYINILPIDPYNTGNPATAGLYGYSYFAPVDASFAYFSSLCPTNLPFQSQYYELVTRLENSSDPDACKAKMYKKCDNTGFCPTSGSNDYLFVITSKY